MFGVGSLRASLPASPGAIIISDAIHKTRGSRDNKTDAREDRPPGTSFVEVNDTSIYLTWLCLTS
jgi:hypothetical protein